MSGTGLRRRRQAALPEGLAKPSHAFSLRLLPREAGRLATPRSISPGCRRMRTNGRFSGWGQHAAAPARDEGRGKTRAARFPDLQAARATRAAKAAAERPKSE